MGAGCWQSMYTSVGGVGNSFDEYCMWLHCKREQLNASLKAAEQQVAYLNGSAGDILFIAASSMALLEVAVVKNISGDDCPKASILPKMHLVEDHVISSLQHYNLGVGLMHGGKRVQRTSMLTLTDLNKHTLTGILIK